MKLELVNTSKKYCRDSLGENTFFVRIVNQISANAFNELTNYLHEEIRSARIRVPLLARLTLKSYEREGKQ
jgi:hypothetical protein